MGATKNIENFFEQEYQRLNKAQKEAVDAIEGPVMVVAGPGTGKTQILALRIGKILLDTDVKADGILCLTFTNSAVKAMRERLRKYIGPEASKVRVATFHGFGMEIMEKYHTALGLKEEPKLMDDKDFVALFDDILQNNDWKFIRPRSDFTRYFRDLKSLISILKRERISPPDFQNKVEEEIQSIKRDPSSISSRGASKGELKKDVQAKIEGLERSLEAVRFYGLYEDYKKEKNLFDYDDILESLVRVVEESEEVKNYIKENFLYVLIDEHQDSSGVQNEFLENVWKGEDRPNIFVVGDDRQLIYGFGGASLQYFENFKNTFGKAKQINLLENYRSTQQILDSAHQLLESSISTGKLQSHHKENHNLRLVEAYYNRDEILSAVLDIKDKLKQGGDVNDMAILVPKNRQVRSTIALLKDMNIPVSAGETLNFFDSAEAISLLRVLKIISNPNDGVALGESFFDKFSGISPLKAHEFIRDNKMRELSLVNIKEEKNSLFDNGNEINTWIGKLKSWLDSSSLPLYSFIQKVGTEFLLDSSQNHEELIVRIEVIRTLLHLALFQVEKNPQLNLKEFMDFLDRMIAYDEHIPLAIFSPNEGVKVLTLHGSKGLEFDYVWIAHMDEKSFGGGRKGGFSLPESVKEKAETRDEEVLKRQLYVAITRAKRFCTISYALKSYTGGDQELAHIVADLEGEFEKQSADETEKIILSSDEKAYVEKKARVEQHTGIDSLKKLVARDYADRKVSVSLLNNFFECPWKWYFRNLLQLPEAQSDSLKFGNDVHSSIDKILKLGHEPSAKELEALNLDKESMSIVVRWVKNRLPEIKLGYKNEQSVSYTDFKFPHLNIYGKIDLIENLGGKEVRVTDFKTGGVRKKSDIEKINDEGRMSSYLRQLSMYSYLLQNSPKWKVDVRESRLEFLEAEHIKDIFYDRVISGTETNLLIKDIEDYDELVKSGAWVERPCQYNSYGKNTECEYCQIAEIYKAGPLSSQPK
ncbi:MAG: ATP-dependent helicase [Candidatus Pacebacteria bacterium]|nr:ATP-dependent helicase [Candidatus Paceibacterota bacterium]